MQERELDAAAATGRSLLTLAVLFGDAGDAQADERLYVADDDAARGDHQHDLVLDADTGQHVGDARVVAARGDVDLIEQRDLLLEGDLERAVRQRVEIVRRPRRTHRHGLRRTAGV